MRFHGATHIYGLQDGRTYHVVTVRTTRTMTTLCGLVGVPVSALVFQSDGSPSPLCLACARIHISKLHAGAQRVKRYACRECRKLAAHELPVRCSVCGARCCSHRAADKISKRIGLCPKCKETSR